jgi:hypothetical protein
MFIVYAEAQLGTRLEKDTNKMTLELPGLQEEDSAAELLKAIVGCWAWWK